MGLEKYGCILWHCYRYDVFTLVQYKKVLFPEGLKNTGSMVFLLRNEYQPECSTVLFFSAGNLPRYQTALAVLFPFILEGLTYVK